MIYIPAVPMCEENFAYAYRVRATPEKDVLPGDFPREGYETNWEGRFMLADLNIHSRQALGMDIRELVEVN